jgi:hypothetical protein
MPKLSKKVKSAKRKNTQRQLPQRNAAPSAQSSKITTRRPQIRRLKESVVIAHREMFDGVVANSYFLTTPYALNPGNQSVFPWLATQAAGWERYRFRKLRVQYVPRCPTSTVGSVILAIDYDAADEAPLNEARACSYYGAISSALWQDIDMSASVTAMSGGMSSKYVTPGVLASNLDIKTYNAGNLFVCTIDSPTDGVAAGKLWVEYEVEFFTPHTLPVPWTSAYNFSRGYNNAPYDPSTGLISGIGSNTAVGPIAISTQANYVTGSVNKFDIAGLIPGARYLIQLLTHITAGTVSSSTWSSLVGLTEVFQEVHGIAAAAGNSVLLSSIFTADKKNASLSAVLGSTSGTINGGVMKVIPISMSSKYHVL